MIRAIVVVEEGLVQTVASSEPIDYIVLDHDVFENCTDRKGLNHEADCPDHTAKEYAAYRALVDEANALQGVRT